ncbi:hypothetical protein Y032_0102g3481 [Ancylostoma ceylanicum]|nr:hypothetical protein Y032_0102g3481 [Ancylostoma ceylanicum]
MLFNLLLLYLVVYKTPRQFEVYAILIGNAAVTDFFACLASLLIQQRIVPVGTSLFYFSHGPCRIIGGEFCYLTYSFMLSCYTHSLYCLLFSFYFRYHVLKKPQFSATKLKLIIVAISLPSLFQFLALRRATLNIVKLCLQTMHSNLLFKAMLSEANDPVDKLIPILEKQSPQYNISGETISGHEDVFEWRLLTAIFHITLPITPVYIGILILRKRIIAMLSTDIMSEHTKRIHSQLLKAITYQAFLPGLFSLGVLSYTTGQLGFFHHPLLETFTIFSFGLLPTLSPLMSLHFITPYRWHVRSLFSGGAGKTLPITSDSLTKSVATTSTEVIYC